MCTKSYKQKRHIIVHKKTLNVVIDGVIIRWPFKCAFVVWFNVYFNRCTQSLYTGRYYWRN